MCWRLAERLPVLVMQSAIRQSAIGMGKNSGGFVSGETQRDRNREAVRTADKCQVNLNSQVYHSDWLALQQWD